MVHITMEDVAGLDGMEILMEGGETVYLDLNVDADLTLNACSSEGQDIIRGQDTPQIDWNSEINAIFNVPTPVPHVQRQTSSRIITGHRLLTIEQIFKEKLA